MEPKLELNIDHDIETKILVIKNEIQMRLLVKAFGIDEEKMFEWIGKNGNTINDYLHTHPELLEMYETDPSTVLETIDNIIKT